jgi:hypothetical protein
MRPTAPRKRALIGGVVLALLSGCIPAQNVPPQLAATAAPPFVITDERLYTERYSVQPPRGWRVIAGAAEDPYTFQFIHPDDTALVGVAVRAIADRELPRPAGLTVAPEQAWVGRVAQGEIALFAVGAPSDSEALTEVMQSVAASVATPTPTPPR